MMEKVTRSHGVRGGTLLHMERRWQRITIGVSVIFAFLGAVEPTPAATKNLLSHSSFETPGNNFWGFNGSKFDESNFSEDKVDGVFSLKWPYSSPYSRAPTRAPRFPEHFGVLMCQSVPIVNGNTYTLSAYVKKLTGASSSVVTLSLLDSNRNDPKTLATKTVALPTVWTRVSLTAVISGATNNRIVPKFEFPGLPPWDDRYAEAPIASGLIDAVQLEEGSGLTVFETDFPVDFGVVPRAQANAFTWGEDVVLDLYVTNTLTTAYSKAVTLIVRDFFDQTIHQASLSLSVLPGQRHKQEIRLGTALRGHYRAIVMDGTRVMTEKIFSTIPPPKTVAAEDSIYGGDGPVTDYILTMARRLGMKWMRPHSEFSWESVEATKGTFTFPDIFLDLAKTAGIQLYGFLYRTPTWARAQPELAEKSFPTSLSDWSNFVNRIVDRYKADITYWEIWNEPWAQFNSAQYLSILESAHAGAKAADPNARLMGWSDPARFYLDDATILSKLLSKLDILSGHYYPTYVSNDGTNLFDALQRHKQIAQGRPLWNTEGGYSGGPTWYHSSANYDPYDSRWDGAYITPKFWAHHKAAGVRLFYYWIQFPSRNVDHFPAYDFSKTFYEYDTSLKVSAVTTAVSAYFLDGADVRFEKILYPGTQANKHVTMFHFVQGTNRNIITAWCDYIGYNVQIKNPTLSGPVNVYDMFGRLTRSLQANERLDLVLSNNPVYIEILNTPPTSIGRDDLQLGADFAGNSILIQREAREVSPVDTLTVSIYGSDQNPPSSAELLYQASVPNPSMATYAWDAPVRRPEASTLALFHFDSRTEIPYLETATRIYDFSGKGNHGTLVLNQGLSLTMSGGKFGGGVQGDGRASSSGSIQIPFRSSFAGLNQFSVEMWLKANEAGTRLFSIGTSTTPPYGGRLRETGGEIIFLVAESASSYTERVSAIGFPQNDNVFHHLAFVYDGSPAGQEERRMDIYLDGKRVNGNLRGSLCKDGAAGPNPSCRIPAQTNATGDPLLLLGDGGGPQILLDGTMDEFALTNRALSDVEIADRVRLKDQNYFWTMTVRGNESATSPVQTEKPAGGGLPPPLAPPIPGPTPSPTPLPPPPSGNAPIAPAPILQNRFFGLFPSVLNLSKGTEIPVRYTLESPRYIRLSLHTMKGHEVAVLDQGQRGGEQQISLKGNVAAGQKLASGFYLLLLEVDGQLVETKKVVVVK